MTFLDGSDASADAHAAALALAARTVARALRSAQDPLPPLAPNALGRLLDIDVAPETGAGLEATLRLVGERIVRNSVHVAHPRCAAHLHGPPLVAALAAEAIVAATNQSLDSWDQAPAATHVESRLIEWLTQLYGLGTDADGVFTSGGSQSNLMGLLLARDRAAARGGVSVARDGVWGVARRFRIVCSSTAHCSVRKSARILGLGERAVVEVPADADGALRPEAVDAALSRLHNTGMIPIALVASAGTTDVGAIDPLAPLAAVARAHGAWFHVDAAVGGALALSEREASRLDGIDLADSITVDFDKLWFQPISCGAFLVREAATLAPALLHADHFDPEPDDADAGFPNLVDKSLQTTRRFDALKLLVTLHAHGRRSLAQAVEATLGLAVAAARIVESHPSLELARPPVLNTVLFRHGGDAGCTARELDRLNDEIRLFLLHSGLAVIGRTRLDGRVCLKLTLTNPATTPDDLRELLDHVTAAGRALSRGAPAAA